MLLRPLGVSDEKQALQAHEELAQDGFEFIFELEQGAAWPVYRGRLESLRLGVGPGARGAGSRANWQVDGGRAAALRDLG